MTKRNTESNSCSDAKEACERNSLHQKSAPAGDISNIPSSVISVDLHSDYNFSVQSRLDSSLEGVTVDHSSNPDNFDEKTMNSSVATVPNSQTTQEKPTKWSLEVDRLNKLQKENAVSFIKRSEGRRK